MDNTTVADIAAAYEAGEMAVAGGGNTALVDLVTALPANHELRLAYLRGVMASIPATVAHHVGKFVPAAPGWRQAREI